MVAEHYLVVDRSEVHIGFHGFTSDAACEHVFAGIAEAILYQDPGHIFYLCRRYSAPKLIRLDVG